MGIADVDIGFANVRPILQGHAYGKKHEVGNTFEDGCKSKDRKHFISYGQGPDLEI